MKLNAFHKTVGLKPALLSKILFVMRITTVLLFAILMQVSASGLAQRITLSEKNASLKKVIEKIREQSSYDFFYIKDNLKSAKPVDVQLNNVSMEEALKAIFEGQPLGYEVKDRVVVIKMKPRVLISELTAIFKSVDVGGRVTDQSRMPIPGVSVKVKNTQKGTVTDGDGKFQLNLNKGDIVVLTYVGFQSQEIIYDGQPSIQVTLEQSSNALGEIVVIGYGAVKQRDVTGAIVQVKAKDLDLGVASSFQQTLQGKASGVQVIQSTGQPGAGVKIQIRSNPSFADAGVLYVIDGVPINDAAGEPSLGGTVGESRYKYGGVDKSPLNFINPNDIESIQFLKDASAASIYGARAGAGVVLITTKRGTEGKSTIEYTGSYGIQKPDKMYPVFGAKDYMIQRNLLREEKWYKDNNIAPYYGAVNPGSVNPYVPVFTQGQIDGAASTNQAATDAITRSGYTQQHNLSLSGGNGKTSYFASGNYFDQKGVIIGTDYKRYNGRLNIDQIVSDKIKIGANIIASNSDANNTITGGANENGGIVTAAIYWAPSVSLRDPDGGYPLSPYYPTIPNPLSYATVTDKTKANRLLSTAYGEWTILEGLKAKANFSYDQSYSKRSSYFPKTFLYGSQANGSASISESDAQSKLFEYTLSYNKNFSEKHHLNAVAGYTFQQSDWEGFNAGNQNFLSDVSLYYSLGAGQSAKPSVGSAKSQTTWASYFARAIYTYNGNITLQASLRRDGSSLFAENKKWGYFPSVSAGWVLSDEAFIKSVKPISFLKLRAGYGETGNSAFKGAAFALYGTAQSAYFGSNTVSSGLVLSRAANPNLTWETAGEFNIGLDYGLFSDRVTGSFDYYNKTIRNLISFVPYPAGFIIDGVFDNAGKTRSRGYDISLQTKNLVPSSADGFTWSTNLTFSHYLNYWVKRSDPALKVLEKYEPVSGTAALFLPFKGYLSDGLFTGQFGTAPGQMPGMLPGGVIIKDIHGYDASSNLVGPDGKITAADLQYIGNQDPEFNFGIGNRFSYKNFDLNIFMSGIKQKKWSPYLNGRATEKTMDSFGFNAMPISANRWTFQNTSGNFPTSLYDATYSGYQNGSDYWLVDATFLRCRNITLGYSLPNKLLAKQHVFSRFRISFDVQNPFTITNYPGLDPELDTDNFYPLVKSYVLGINASF
ncbi:TonB-dependent receptor [Pedobacter sp. N36a]|uniref:TonB-dependent receptor n=1 Tax=Pedobacter sp. N36a TaxID=2767996 RepID=UPI00165726E5|nr:TonB-dependent receptor [Pedobacter sp. N36a]MBC8988023.1 TonB-dependent receptor [Pedobacter sp. N36a]